MTSGASNLARTSWFKVTVDIVAVLEFEDLHHVALCGASYGGMAVTGAADRVADRIALVVYVDALVPRGGQSGLDLLPAAFGAMVRAAADARGHGWVPIPPGVPPEGLIAAEDRARYIARLRPQPVATFTEPLRLTSAIDRLPRAFVRCTRAGFDVGGDPIAPMAARARTEGWPYRELVAPHDPHLFDLTGTAAVLHELAAVVGGRGCALAWRHAGGGLQADSTRAAPREAAGQALVDAAACRTGYRHDHQPIPTGPRKDCKVSGPAVLCPKHQGLSP